MAKDDKPKNMVEQVDKEEDDAEKPGASSRKRGGKVARKRGGKIPGMASMSRPDRRARGGATSDMNPTTAAGNVSEPSYMSKSAVSNGGGMGGDKSAYGGGSHRRPG